MPHLLNVMTTKEKAVFICGVIIWLLNCIIFFAWWLNTDFIIELWQYLLTTVMLVWTLLMPGYFYFFVWRMKRPNPNIKLPKHWRIAMVVTKAPSEPFSMLKNTLLAMLQQSPAHDNWLADEDPTEEVLAWCAANGIKVSTRKGVAAYHRETWPRRTRCKEGNLSYFYDYYGYKQYDFVVQLDADHIPQKGYLEAMLRPFVDEAIGYVSAPSICNLNESSSWAARGRLYSEAIMHGPLQAGYSKYFAPLCIGSHYAVRTKALKAIGGLGPELAEDHSTSLMFNGHGWRGVHAFDAIAHGLGPETFADCLTQEFQWSRSLVVLMLTEMPKYFFKMPLRIAFQFLFSQLWYVIFSFTMLAAHIIPFYAVVTHVPFVQVSYIDFLLHFLPVTLSVIGLSVYMRQQGWLRPSSSPAFSWETVLFNTVRWPWALYGCVMGFWAVISGEQNSFKVTPKGEKKPPYMASKIIGPYLMLCLLSFLPSVFIRDAKEASGYFFFLLLNLVIYIIAVGSLIIFQLKESQYEKAGEAYDY